jgi:hypothetical protein
LQTGIENVQAENANCGQEIDRREALNFVAAIQSHRRLAETIENNRRRRPFQ